MEIFLGTILALSSVVGAATLFLVFDKDKHKDSAFLKLLWCFIAINSKIILVGCLVYIYYVRSMLNAESLAVYYILGLMLFAPVTHAIYKLFDKQREEA